MKWSPPSVIPAKAGIQCLDVDSGSPFYFARHDGRRRSGWYPRPVSVVPHTADRSTVIPAKAGIQCLGMDSGAPFHSARNDGMVRRGGYPRPVSEFPHTADRSSVIPAKAGIQCLGLDSGSPFHSARNDGMGRGSGVRSPSVNSHTRQTVPPSFPRKRESSASAWIPGLRFTPPGMTGSGVVVSLSRCANAMGMAGVLRVSPPLPWDQARQCRQHSATRLPASPGDGQ